jgi:hypothetical protein
MAHIYTLLVEKSKHNRNKMMSGGACTSFVGGKSHIRVAITNLAPTYSSKPKVSNNNAEFIKCDDPSSLPDCRAEPLHRALSTVVDVAPAEGADLVLLLETFACADMDMNEMKYYADKQV